MPLFALEGLPETHGLQDNRQLLESLVLPHHVLPCSVGELPGSDRDFLVPLVQGVVQEMREAKMDACLRAGKHERTAERLGYCSGYYERRLITRLGRLELRVPRNRDGRSSTELFERWQGRYAQLRDWVEDNIAQTFSFSAAAGAPQAPEIVEHAGALQRGDSGADASGADVPA